MNDDWFRETVKFAGENPFTAAVVVIVAVLVVYGIEKAWRNRY